MTDPQVFYPSGRLLTVSRLWILYLLLLPLLFVIAHRYAPELLPVAFIIALIALLGILITRQPLRIEVSVRLKTLQYVYRSSWGSIHTAKVDLSTAGGHYNFEVATRSTRPGWRLVLYNGSLFRNRISVKQRERGGFTRKQLDEIVALVHQCKNSSRRLNR